MIHVEDQASNRFADAILAARLMAVDPVRLGGIVVRARSGPVREAWTNFAIESFEPELPRIKVPPGITASSLMGQNDLAASLAAGRPVSTCGLIEQSRGGIMVLPMAERIAPEIAAILALGLETERACGSKQGYAKLAGAGLLLFDESENDEARPAQVLMDRVAFDVDLDGVSVGAALGDILEAPEAPPNVKERLNNVRVSDEDIAAIAEAVIKLGIPSLRAPIFALNVARCHAALNEREQVIAEDLAVAGRLVLAPRARQLPQGEEQADESQKQEQSGPQESGTTTETAPDSVPENIVLQAASIRLPKKLLESNGGKAVRTAAGRIGARSGAGERRPSLFHGRPAGARRGQVRDGVRLSVYETLRAAAPWQRIRRDERGRERRTGAGQPDRHLEIRLSDLRLKQFTNRAVTTAIFLVDASGSAASQRLAESKGAVEYFLNDCYVRRDQVALISFRGKGAELLVPPTRSLTRARRLLTALPGGGGTPLASGLETAAALAQSLRRRGQTPLLVILTDGKANVALDGLGNRPRAASEANAAACALAASGVRSLVLDLSLRGTPEARSLAESMQARYLLIPGAEASKVAGAVTKARKELQVRS